MRRITVGGVLLGALLSTSHVGLGQATGPAPLVSSTQALKQGVALHDEGKYATAISSYLAVPSSDTSYALVQAELALSYYANKQYKEAIAASERAILLGHQEPQTFNTLASAQEEELGRDVALKTYQRGLQQYPFSQLLWYNQAITQNAANQPEAAFASLQRSLTLRPMHAGSHLLLGQLAARQQQTAHAMLSLATYLAIEPGGAQSNQVLVLLEQLASHTTQYEEKEKLPATFPNADFEELDQLLDAKIALRKDYTTPVKFDANVVKQLQLLVEKYPAASATPADFWLRMYSPMVETLRNPETRTAFTYLILSSAGDAGGRKWVKSNKSKVDKMIAAVQPALLKLREQQPVSRQGYPAQMSGWFTNEGVLFGLGPGTVVDRAMKPTGAWLLVGEGGAVTGEGSFNASHEKNGPWRFYYADGTLEKAVNYDAQGLFTGEYRDYHENGTLSVSGSYLAGKPEGPAKVHYYCGAVREARLYKDGQLNGPLESFYPDGKVESRSSFRNDQKHGVETGYYPDGTTEYEYTFVDGRRQGPFTVYYADKKPEKKGSYDFNELHGEYTEYHDNGKVAQTGTYEHGKQTGTWKIYFRNGQLSEVENYDAEGQLHGQYQDYEDDGKLAAEFQYDHGQVTSLTYFDKAGKELSRTVLRKGGGTVRGLYPNGSVAYTGTYLNGKRSGEWRWLRRDGSVRLVRQYQEGKAHGRSEGFYRNGQLESSQEYVEGTLEGPSKEFYLDGVTKSTGYYRNGQQEGQWQDFYADGTLSEEYNLHEGTSQGFDHSYSPTGKLTEERRNLNGRLQSMVAFDSTGQVLDRIVLRPDSKGYALHYPGGKTRLNVQLICYERQGTNTWFSPDGKTSATTGYQRNSPAGISRTYHPNGKVASEGRFVNGRREGEWVAYYATGQLRFKGTYHQGDEEGEWAYYAENGQPDVLYTYQGGELHGSVRQYNLLGELVLERVYEHGELMQFRAQVGGEGKPEGAVQPVPAGPEFALRSQFANGRPAAEEVYRAGMLDGTRTLYYSSGQVYRRSFTRQGSLAGLLTTYYPDGKKLEEEYYLHNELHGRCKYYRPNGTLEREETYRAGEKAGPTVYYDVNGKPLKTEFYWNTYVYGTK
ncbi:hypothetical protein HER32_07485 [Hymenobacter sp. BT18]|uniref:toxin-antitoxin system YwqK family antitoxin n=1 Tax=Hymenobacter sp. BT18 TaxID=2835648 RepID=UPI00143EECA7|nr:toxin-antitoxin system YwqK family antitoxin [Hymenobacter sp. BT18]QIX61031.1 hypothetical protein HER32_07485 [Hymenobacter sp. BT18]